MVKLYVYKNCDTCRKAIKWLAANGHGFTEIAIREQPPEGAEFLAALDQAGGNLKKLFNVSGQDYRRLKLKDSLPTLSVDEAICLLGENGNLVKRPFLVSSGGSMAGFDEKAWSALLA